MVTNNCLATNSAKRIKAFNLPVLNLLDVIINTCLTNVWISSSVLIGTPFMFIFYPQSHAVI